MAEIIINSINYKPNIRILKNHIITFNNNEIILFDHKGYKIDSLTLNINKDILDICVIKTNLFISMTNTDLFEIYINNNKLEIKNIIFGRDNIIDSLYIKKYNLFILSHQHNIKICDINSLNKKPIQIINTFLSSFLFFWNKNSFIIFMDSILKISIFIKKYNINYYELISNFKFKNFIFILLIFKMLKKLLKFKIINLIIIFLTSLIQRKIYYRN